MTTPRDHIDHIMLVMEAAFDPAYGEAWNRRQVTDALTMPTTHALIIDAQGNLIGAGPADPSGFVMTRAAAGEEELLLIAVMPDLRARGLGKVLIEKMFEAARARGSSRVFLEMRRGNPAVHLYRKLGFEPIGERPNYYRTISGERIDAITFGCSI